MDVIKLYNTLTRKKEAFKPIHEGKVGLYSCGPTVYHYAHIGNLRAYIFADVLKKTLELNELDVRHVINITDVGHLTSDADEGEDKIEKSARSLGKTAKEITEFFTKAFEEDLKKLNIAEPSVWTKATDYITEQIALVKLLEKKGFTYRTSDGIYFDTSKLKNYGALARIDVAGLKEGARVEKNPEKRNATDFALWKLSEGSQKRLQEWPSPWGVGFPGWHIECSVMSTAILGQPFDIHTGGIDHIPVHHPNEMAQSEAAYGKPLANFWLHNEHLIIKGGRMGKSEGNFVTLNELIAQGFDPLAFRYLCLQAHYRSKIEFSQKALKGAQNALRNLREKAARVQGADDAAAPHPKTTTMRAAFSNDLDAPNALAILWEEARNKKTKGLLTLFAYADRVLSLNLVQQILEIPKKIQLLVEKRNQARREKQWDVSDRIREEIEKAGFMLEDTPGDTHIYQKKS